MLGNVSTAELLIILAVLIGIFGKKKTSEIARDAGEASKELRKARQEAIEAVEELRRAEEQVSKPASQTVLAEEGKEEKKEAAPAAEESSEPTAEQLDKEMIEIARSKKQDQSKGGEKAA